MPRRNTRTGAVLEQMVLPALTLGGYTCRTQVKAGRRPGGGRHVVDVVAEKDGRRWVISMKWQQVAGTAEQKVPFEVISLADLLRGGGYETAYLVLGGPGWTLRSFYTDGGLQKRMTGVDGVRIVTLEDFIACANQGAL